MIVRPSAMAVRTWAMACCGTPKVPRLNHTAQLTATGNVVLAVRSGW